MKIYAFDVDDTLWFSPSPGPVTESMVKELRDQGHIVGLLGQWAHTRVLDKYTQWHKLFSFVGMVPWSNEKGIFMIEFKTYVTADDYVMVGNRPQDEIQANIGNWRFLSETEFAEGRR